MPAVSYREDDDPDGAPLRARRPPPRALRPSDVVDDREHDSARRPPIAHRAPALEGLTASGAAVVGLLGTTIGAVLDAIVSPGLGWLFFVTFFVMSAFMGLRLRRHDAWASTAVPPLVYISAAGIAAQAAPATEGNWLERTSGDMAAVVLDHPYILLIGTALAVVGFAYRAIID